MFATPSIMRTADGTVGSSIHRPVGGSASMRTPASPTDVRLVRYVSDDDHHVVEDWRMA
jgi:hypothetical protein